MSVSLLSQGTKPREYQAPWAGTFLLRRNSRFGNSFGCCTFTHFVGLFYSQILIEHETGELQEMLFFSSHFTTICTAEPRRKFMY